MLVKSCFRLRRFASHKVAVEAIKNLATTQEHP
jgi:hypothetical protein